MATFEESKHPRHQTGKFAPKLNPEAEQSMLVIDVPADDRQETWKPVHVEPLDRGGYEPNDDWARDRALEFGWSTRYPDYPSLTLRVRVQRPDGSVEFASSSTYLRGSGADPEDLVDEALNESDYPDGIERTVWPTNDGMVYGLSCGPHTIKITPGRDEQGHDVEGFHVVCETIDQDGEVFADGIDFYETAQEAKVEVASWIRAMGELEQKNW